MRDLVVLFIHLIATLARLLGPGGARSIVPPENSTSRRLLSRTISGSTISVVIVAGACGIAAGTPLAILGAIGRAARHGFIIKGGLHRGRNLVQLPLHTARRQQPLAVLELPARDRTRWHNSNSYSGYSIALLSSVNRNSALTAAGQGGTAEPTTPT